jgi:hypothetical protein
MNTQDLSDTDRLNIDICDRLEDVRQYLFRGGCMREQEIVERARLYIANLRGRVNTIDLTPPSIIAPIGFDGQVCGEWLAEQVERRMEALRDESIDARQRADQAACALNAFGSRINHAAR